jgi:hypothetical protein
MIFNNALTLLTLNNYIANSNKFKKHQYESPFGFITTILLISLTYYYSVLHNKTSVHDVAAV